MSGVEIGLPWGINREFNFKNLNDLPKLDNHQGTHRQSLDIRIGNSTLTIAHYIGAALLNVAGLPEYKIHNASAFIIDESYIPMPIFVLPGERKEIDTNIGQITIYHLEEP